MGWRKFYLSVINVLLYGFVLIIAVMGSCECRTESAITFDTETYNVKCVRYDVDLCILLQKCLKWAILFYVLEIKVREVACYVVPRKSRREDKNAKQNWQSTLIIFSRNIIGFPSRTALIMRIMAQRINYTARNKIRLLFRY